MKGIVKRLGNLFKGRTMKRFVRNEQGATAAEYAVLVLLAASLIITAVAIFGGNIRDAFYQAGRNVAGLGSSDLQAEGATYTFSGGSGSGSN